MIFFPKSNRETSTDLTPFLSLPKDSYITIDGFTGYIHATEQSESEYRVTLRTGGTLVTFIQKV